MGVFVLACGANVCQLFASDGIDDKIAGTAVFTDDLPFIDCLSRLDKEDTSVVECVEGLGGYLPRLIRNEHTKRTLYHAAAERLVAQHRMVHDGIPLRSVEHSAA